MDFNEVCDWFYCPNCSSVVTSAAAYTVFYGHDCGPVTD